jgi:hypothetical protein
VSVERSAVIATSSGVKPTSASKIRYWSSLVRSISYGGYVSPSSTVSFTRSKRRSNPMVERQKGDRS